VLSKGSQKANWGRRPLSPTMLEYAHNDTRYLIELTARMEERLTRLGRTEWCRQSCERVVEQALGPSNNEGRERWRIKGWATTRGLETALLRALWHWREEEAKTIDRPAFHILRNEDLLRTAKELAAGQEAPLHHLSGGKRRRLNAVVADTLQLPESEWPKKEPSNGKRMTSDQEKRVEQLKALRDKKAAALDLDPSFIAPRTTLERIIIDDSHDSLLPWQRGVLFGDE
jgi:ribonuclease D